MEGMLIVTRSRWDDFHIPVVYATSPNVHKFFEMLTKLTMQEFSIRMEAYCIAGVHGEHFLRQFTTILLDAVGQAGYPPCPGSSP